MNPPTAQELEQLEAYVKCNEGVEGLPVNREQLARLIAYARDRMKTCRWEWKNHSYVSCDEGMFVFVKESLPDYCQDCGRTVEVVE